MKGLVVGGVSWVLSRLSGRQDAGLAAKLTDATSLTLGNCGGFPQLAPWW
jgi:hypothetical protein